MSNKGDSMENKNNLYSQQPWRNKEAPCMEERL